MRIFLNKKNVRSSSPKTFGEYREQAFFLNVLFLDTPRNKFRALELTNLLKKKKRPSLLSLIVILILLLQLSCSKEELGPQCESCASEVLSIDSSDVLIVNEGNFGWGNGSLSLYQPNSKNISNNVYSLANNNLPLGDVIQSAYQLNDKIYVVANNSNKIEIINKNTFINEATITGFNSPRYFLPINNNKAYVSDLYSNSIQVIDLNTNTITNNINTNGWSENMLLHNDTAYVCDMTNNNLLIINTNNDNLVDSVKVGVSPNSLVLDANNKIWIMCSGGFQEDNPKLIRFNPQTRNIEATFVFSNINESPSNLSINNNKTQFYFLNTNVYTLNINATSLPTSSLINSNGNTFYGLGIHPASEDIYVADAIDYVQSGFVYRYSTSGSLVDQFNVGIIPGNFLFLQ